MCFLVWIYIIFIITWNVFKGATKNFSKTKLGMEESILGNNVLSQVGDSDALPHAECYSTTNFQIFTVSSTALPIVMLVMYGIIFLVIIKKRSLLTGNNASSSAQDRSLLWQALAVSVMLEVSSASTMFSEPAKICVGVVTFLKLGLPTLKLITSFINMIRSDRDSCTSRGSNLHFLPSRQDATL